MPPRHWSVAAFISAIALSTFVADAASVATEVASPVVARIGSTPIRLGAIDVAGGRTTYDAAQQLYEARVRALYQFLSDELLKREADEQRTTVEKLLDEKVTRQARQADAKEVDTALQARGPSQPVDAKGRQQAQLYLNMRHRAEQKQSYIASLMKKYDVRVSLDPPPPPPAEDVSGPETPVMGPAGAPVSIVVWSDYLCPYCRELSHTLERLQAAHPNDLKVIYRTLPVHADSGELAEAALCASDQGAFDAYHRLLFASATPRVDQLESLAHEAGIDTTAFADCRRSRRHRARVDADRAQGEQLRITGTPTLFVAGFRMSGLQSYEKLESQIATALTAHRTP